MEKSNTIPERGIHKRPGFRGRRLERRGNRGNIRRVIRGDIGTGKESKIKERRGLIREARGRRIRHLRSSSFVNSDVEDITGNNQNGNQFSYEKLKDIINKEDNDIIQYLKNFKDLSDVFNNTKFSNKNFDLFTELLIKISKINLVPASNSLYQILKNTNFNNMAKSKLAKEEFNDENYLHFINNLILLNDRLIDKFTDDTIRIKYGEISEYVDIIKEMIDNGNYINNLQLAKNIVTNLEKLSEKEKHKKLI